MRSLCTCELLLKKRACAVDDRRRIIEQANDNKVIMSLAKYPQAGKCVSRCTGVYLYKMYYFIQFLF